jgi:DNA-binding NtrC family response regulator
MFLRPSPRNESTIRSSLPLTAWRHVGRHALEQLLAIARTDCHILIIGSTKIDRADCAQMAHENSRRAAAPIVSVNCAEIASRGWEDALFSQMQMPAGGVKSVMEDPIAAAEGGTLFLDEVHALSLPSQMKLLRFLEDKKYRRLGQTRLRRADVRLIAATTADLSVAIRERRFCEELLLHLHLISIETPSLWCRRKADMRFLLDQCLIKIREHLAKFR